ncbi:MAG: SRPBCC family protein [Myxococcota bacterium]
MEIKTTVETTIRTPREDFFDLAVSNDALPRLFHSYGPLAGVAKAEMLEGRAVEEGATRRVTMTDGMVMDEMIVELRRPSVHRYRWLSALHAPLSWLVSGCEALWVFTDVPGGTHLNYSYTFRLTSALAYPFAKPITWLMRRWQLSAIERAKTELVRG